jgi:hypothetical protein
MVLDGVSGTEDLGSLDVSHDDASVRFSFSLLPGAQRASLW